MKDDPRYGETLAYREDRNLDVKQKLRPYLTNYLKIEAIHWYINLNISQTIEKLDLATCRSLRFERMNAKRNNQNGLNLQVVINIGPNC